MSYFLVGKQEQFLGWVLAPETAEVAAKGPCEHWRKSSSSPGQQGWGVFIQAHVPRGTRLKWPCLLRLEDLAAIWLCILCHRWGNLAQRMKLGFHLGLPTDQGQPEAEHKPGYITTLPAPAELTVLLLNLRTPCVFARIFLIGKCIRESGLHFPVCTILQSSIFSPTWEAIVFFFCSGHSCSQNCV